MLQQCPTVVFEVGSNLLALGLALVGMIGTAIAGYGVHSLRSSQTNGGK